MLLIIINQLHWSTIPTVIDNLMVVLRCHYFFTARRNKRFFAYPSLLLVWRINSLVKIVDLKLILWLELVLERFFLRSKLFIIVFPSSTFTIHTFHKLNRFQKKCYQGFHPDWQKDPDSYFFTNVKIVILNLIIKNWKIAKLYF